MSHGGTASVRSTVDEGELHALVDGCLGSDRRGAVLAHLLVEAADRERVEAYRRQLHGLTRIRQGLDRYAEGFAPELQRALADTVRRVRRRQLLLRGAGALVAASLLLAAGLGAVSVWWQAPEPVATIVYEPELPVPEFPFGGSTSRFAEARPEGDRERSLAWLAGHLRDQPLELPDLRGLGLVPVGGEVLDGGSAPAVRLAWSNGHGGLVDLYVGVVSSDAAQAFTMADEGRVSLHWRRGRLVFALVGPAESPDLLHVMHAFIHDIGRAPEAVPLPSPRPASEEPRPIRAVVEPVERPVPVVPELAVPPAPARDAPATKADTPKQL